MWYNIQTENSSGCSMEICGIVFYLLAMIFQRRKFDKEEPWGIDDDLMFYDDWD